MHRFTYLLSSTYKQVLIDRIFKCGMKIRFCQTNFSPTFSINIIPLDILHETLIKRCCLGCNKLVFLPPKDNLRKYTDQLVPAINNQTDKSNNKTSKADIIIPSEHVDGVREIVLGHHFAKLTQFKSVYFISRTKKTKTTQLLYTLFTSAFKSWPLFVIALILAVCAGIIIWLSVSFSLSFFHHSSLLSHPSFSFVHFFFFDFLFHFPLLLSSSFFFFPFNIPFILFILHPLSSYHTSIFLPPSNSFFLNFHTIALKGYVEEQRTIPSWFPSRSF